MKRLSLASGQGKSELIRQAIDEFIGNRDIKSRLRLLRSAKGIWARRKDIQDVRKLRAEFDRF